MEYGRKQAHSMAEIAKLIDYSTTSGESRAEVWMGNGILND
jgi:hypothetical protein